MPTSGRLLLTPAAAEALKRPCMGPLLYINLFYSSFTLFQSNFAPMPRRAGLSIRPPVWC